MSALREWAASLGEAAHKAVAVSSLGKYKTSCQVSLGPTATSILLMNKERGTSAATCCCSDHISSTTEGQPGLEWPHRLSCVWA